MYNTVINNGLLIDPANRIQAHLNLGIKNGKIVKVSKNLLEGERIVDADGLIVTPGFIDMHMHEDGFRQDKNDFELCITECMLRMGVTTAIGGNCGIGPEDPGYYLNKVDEKGLPVNMGLLVPHEELRNAAGEFDKYKSVDDSVIEDMAQLLDSQLAKGCLGLSFGLRYIPGVSKREMYTLAKIVKKHKKIIAAHIRDDAGGVIGALGELIDLGIEFSIPVQVSHIGSMAAFGQMEEVLKIIDHFRSNGVDIGLDCYPYNAYCTKIGSATYDDGFLDRYNTSYDSIEITEGTYRGLRCTKEIFREVRRTQPEILAVAHVMKESEIDMALIHPATILASDGLLHNGNGHPRASGAFPRFINQYVKEKQLVSLFQAIEKMTVLPAQRLGIQKGSLAVGGDADITIFDYNVIADAATFMEPLLACKGISYVLIGGEPALKEGRIINPRLGRAIRAD